MTIQPEEQISIECNCGWETAGAVAEVVQATQEHVLRVHWQEVTEQDVLEMAQPIK